MVRHTALSVRAVLLGASSLNLSGLCGVTTYIRDVLCRGVAYRRPLRRRGGGGGGGKSSSATRGLVLGRRLDRAFHAYVSARGRSARVSPLVRGVVGRLSSCGMSACGSQVRVGVRSLGIRTELDGVCVDRRGGVWVLELKNTQQTKSEHAASYDAVSPSCPVLRNGMVNSERVRHGLQTGFGMLAFLECFGSSVPSVRGIVVVNCVDGAVAHPVDFAVYGDRRHFVHGKSSSAAAAVAEC